MKKFAALLLAVLYITTSSGVVLNVHYCMGKISSVEVDNFSKEICKCGKAGPDMSCCFSQFKLVKLDGAHKATVVAQNINVPVSNLPSHLSLIDVSKTFASTVSIPVANAPPLNSSPNIYIKNCVFRI